MPTNDSENLSLTPEETSFVQKCVASGRYPSARDVVQISLRMLQKHEQDRQAQIANVRRLVAEGVAQLDRGEGIEAETVFREMAERRERLHTDQSNPL